MRRGPRLRGGLVGLVAAASIVMGLLPGVVSAHPLGNFTVNHLSQVRISQGSVEVHYILDQAEIPTFQETQRFDRNGDGAITGPEREPLLRQKLAAIAPDLRLTVDGRVLALDSARAATLAFPPGQGGLSLTRVETSFVAAIPPGAHRIQLHDDTYGDRVGWKAIEIAAGRGDRRALERSGERSDRRPARLPGRPPAEPAGPAPGELRGERGIRPPHRSRWPGRRAA